VKGKREGLWELVLEKIRKSSDSPCGKKKKHKRGKNKPRFRRGGPCKEGTCTKKKKVRGWKKGHKNREEGNRMKGAKGG